MELEDAKKKYKGTLPILLCGLAIPISLFLWFGNIAFVIFTNNKNGNVRSNKIYIHLYIYIIYI